MNQDLGLHHRPYLLVAAGTVIAALIVSGVMYGQLPAEMATHWDTAGEPDGQVNKAVGAVLLPAIAGLVIVFMVLARRVDPLGENIAAFEEKLDAFIAVIAIFLAYVHALVLVVNLGVKIDILTGMAPAIGFLYYAAGMFMRHAKQNWFFGIRTPWTMSSNIVWHETHLIGSRLFKFAGIMAMLGVLFPRSTILFVVVPVVTVAAVSVAYSYVAYHHIVDRSSEQ